MNTCAGGGVGQGEGEKQAKLLFDLRSAVIKNYLIFSSTFRSCSVFLFFFLLAGGSSQLFWDTRGSHPKNVLMKIIIFCRRCPSNPTSPTPTSYKMNGPLITPDQGRVQSQFLGRKRTQRVK